LKSISLGVKLNAAVAFSSEQLIQDNDLTKNRSLAMDKNTIQDKIRYSSIGDARDHGVISKEEAEFLLAEYMKEFERKVQARSEKH
jgi:hypothetical protein